MLSSDAFHQLLVDRGVRFYCGVPDSLMKDYLAWLDRREDGSGHVIAANEGNAIALAAGHHLATGAIPLVYMQNSGLGNAINPLASLTHPEVYGIPLLLLIGWRGEPGTEDEPQHRTQGRVTVELLESLGIPWRVLPADADEARVVVGEAFEHLAGAEGPFALLVRKGTFQSQDGPAPSSAGPALGREAALEVVVDALPEDAAVVATTGKASRELFEHRRARGSDHGRDFLCVGSMGHASQIALGVALARPERSVWILDGDGALIMHMGALAIIGTQGPANLRHVVFNNAAHDSVGGQPTAGSEIDLPAIAAASGYAFTARAESADEVARTLAEVQRTPGPGFLEIRVSTGARPDLGRPSVAPADAKRAFMGFLAGAS